MSFRWKPIGQGSTAWKRRRTSYVNKARVLELATSGKTVQEIADCFGVTAITIRGILGQERRKNADSQPAAQQEKLSKEGQARDKIT